MVVETRSQTNNKPKILFVCLLVVFLVAASITTWQYATSDGKEAKIVALERCERDDQYVCTVRYRLEDDGTDGVADLCKYHPGLQRFLGTSICYVNQDEFQIDDKVWVREPGPKIRKPEFKKKSVFLLYMMIVLWVAVFVTVGVGVWKAKELKEPNVDPTA
jgi:hypothetical protein